MTTEYIEHKLLYYSTRDKFDGEVEKIAPTSIAFIGDLGLIYTHEKFFGGGGSGGGTTNTETTYEIYKPYVKDDIDQAVRLLLDAVNAKIELTATKSYVDNALTDFGQNLNITNTVKQILDAQTPSWSVLVERIGKLEGSDREVLDQIASITASLAGLNGEPGSVVDLTAVYDRIRNLEDADDEFETWKTHAQAEILALANGDISSVQLSAIYEQLNALNSKITSAESAMEAEADANGAKWTAYTLYKQNLEDWQQETTAKINLLSNADEASVTLLAILNALNDDDTRQVAAKIFAQASEEGSLITLSADQIDFGDNSLESRIRVIANEIIMEHGGQDDPENPQEYMYLTPDGILFINNTVTPHVSTILTQEDGLKHTVDGTPEKHGYWLKPDGSGELAFGNITWTKNGVLTTHGIMLKEAEELGAANAFIVDSVLLCPTYEKTGVSDFQSTDYFTIINYHICKSGFIIKLGEARLDSNYFMTASESNERFVSVWEYGTYGVAADSTLYSAGYRTYKLPSVSAQSVLASISNTIKGELWKNLIKNGDGENIFSNGDNVYVGFPGQIFIVEANSSSVFAGIVDGAEGSSTFSSNAAALATDIRNDLISLGLWKSPVYKYRGEYKSTESYEKYDIVSLISTDSTSFTKRNYLCLKDNTLDAPDPNAPATENSRWVDCRNTQTPYSSLFITLDGAGDSSGSAYNDWQHGSNVQTDHTYLDSSNNTVHVVLYHVGGTYQYKIEPETATRFETKPILFYGSHIISWNNSGFSHPSVN